MSDYGSVLDAVFRMRHGTLFTPRDLVHLAPRSTVDFVLWQWSRADVARRVARGVYFRPFPWRRDVQPGLDEIVRTRARANGERLGVHPADAARSFGFDVRPARTPRYGTSGRTRTLTIAETQVRFRHVPCVVGELTGTRAGDALAALHHLGAAAAPALLESLDDPDRELVARVLPRLPDAWARAWAGAGRPPVREPAHRVSVPARTLPGDPRRTRAAAPAPRA